MRTFLVLVVQLILLTSLANAQSSISAVKEFGLFGTWALDCSQPPGPANAYVSFTLTLEGTVELRDSFGPDYDEMVYRVVQAKRVGAFRLAMRQVLMTDERIVLETETLRTRDRIRNWSSRFSDGSGTLVEDGRMSADEGHETAWLARCDLRRADDIDSAPSKDAHL